MIFKRETKLNDWEIKQRKVSDEVVERGFIMDFLYEIPLSKLKQLVNFQKIEPEPLPTYFATKEREMFAEQSQFTKLKCELEIKENEQE